MTFKINEAPINARCILKYYDCPNNGGDGNGLTNGQEIKKAMDALNIKFFPGPYGGNLYKDMPKKLNGGTPSKKVPDYSETGLRAMLRIEGEPKIMNEQELKDFFKNDDKFPSIFNNYKRINRSMFDYQPLKTQKDCFIQLDDGKPYAGLSFEVANALVNAAKKSNPEISIFNPKSIFDQYGGKINIDTIKNIRRSLFNEQGCQIVKK